MLCFERGFEPRERERERKRISLLPDDSNEEEKEIINIALCCVELAVQSANQSKVALLLPHHLPGGDTMATAF